MEQTIIEYLADAVIVLDTSDRIIYANSAASTLLQQPASSLIGQTAQQAIPKWASLAQVAHGRVVTGSEQPPQRWFDVSISPVNEPNGGPLGKLISWHDITDVQALVENAPNPIFSINRDGMIQSWNRACEVVLGYQHNQIIGRPYRLVAHSLQSQFLEQAIEDVFQQGATFQEVELGCRSQDGTEYYMASRLYPQLDSSGRVEACVVANTNITERTLSEQALQRQLKELSILHAVATASVEVNSEDALIEIATRIIGDTLNPDNFGILLLNEKTQRVHKHPTYRDRTRSAPDSIPLGSGVASKVIQESRPIRIPDITREPDYLMIDPETRSELCVPMRANNRVIGVINSESRTPNAYSADDERLLVTLAGQLSTAIERLRAEAVAHKHIQELLAISRISREISSVLDRQQVLDSIVRHAAQISSAAASGLFLRQADGRLYLVSAYGLSEAFVQQANAIGVPMGEGSAVGLAAQLGRPVQYNDLSLLPAYQMQRLIAIENLRAVLAVPMLQGETIVGGIVIWHRSVYHFSDEEEMFLQALAHQSVNAVENARLFETERQQRKIAEVLRDTGSALSATLDINSLLDTLLVQVERLVPYDAANFTFVENGVGRIARVRGYEKFGPAFDQTVRLLTLRIADTPNLRWMVAHQQPKFIADTRLDPEWILISRDYPFNSWVGAPVLSQNLVCAFFSLDSITPGFYQQEHADRLNMLAGQASLALQNARLFEETQQQASRMARLARISEELNQPQTADEVVSAIGQGALALAEADRGAVYVRTSESTVYCAWSYEISASYIIQVSQQLRSLPGGQLFTQTEPVIIPDIAALSPDSLLRRLAEAEGLCSLGLWPLVYQGQVIAAVGLYYNTPHEWNSRQGEILLAFTRQAAIALQNAHLFEETQRRAAQQETLNHIIAAAVSVPELADLMETVLDLALEVIGVESGGIWLKGRNAQRKLPAEFPYASLRSAGRGWSHVPMTLIISDWEQIQPNNTLYPLKPVMVEANLRAMLVVPLLSSGIYTGEMALGTAAPREWKPEEIALVEAIGRQIGSAAERLDLLTQTQEQAQQVQQIMDSVPEGVILLSSSYQVLMANPAAMALLTVLLEETDLGRPLTSLAGKPIEELLKDSANHIWDELSIPATPPRIFEAAARPLNSGDNASGWVLVLRDVTQERSNLARIQMQERLATVGQLAAGIAHDFNNIMAAVVVYADLLSLQPDLKPTSREQISIIQQQVQRATGLIRQILDFSRRSMIEPHPLDILPFLKEFDKLLERVLPENISLRLVYQSGAYRVKADPIRLQQVLMNLALNGRDAMPNGGTLTFTLERMCLQPDEQIPLPDLAPGSWVRLTIQDTGIGIAGEHLPHIFDPFFTTKPVGKGTGLGLAQVYGIVKQHGGCIDVHSQLDQGTAFTLYLPELDDGPAGDTRQPTETRMPKIDNPVLLVEDDQAARSALQSLMESQGLRVLVAANGSQALKLYTQAEGQVALVVSDVVMPEMGGIELYQALQQRQPGLKFLFITGHPLDTEDYGLLDDRSVHRLLKPFSVQDFIHTVRRLLSTR